jgi:DNA-binding transcriptional LysR family regulator
MELRHLRYFVAVAEELHFGHAAERLHICQPPLSQQIKDLEQELGVQLFLRRNRKISLTEAGAAFLEDARDVLHRVESAAEKARSIAQGNAGSISMGFVLPAMDTFVPDAIREFRAANPDVEIHLREMGTLAQLEALEAGRINVGVVRLYQQSTKGLVVEIIVEEPYVLALPSGHPLADGETIPLSALHREPVILFPRETHPALHDRIIACFSAAGCTPKISQEATTKVTTVALVAAGIGAALVPASTRKQRREGVVYRAVSGDLPLVQLSLVWREDADSASLHRLTDAVLAMRDQGGES